VKDITVGARVLGLYGTSGLGKSTLCKALCDYFSGKILGRVCHVELGETSRMGRDYQSGFGEMSRLKRQNTMLQKLCGFDEDLLGRITEIGQVKQFVT
jgi:ABC-type glutathione transport system ATPase component